MISHTMAPQRGESGQSHRCTRISRRREDDLSPPRALAYPNRRVGGLPIRERLGWRPQLFLLLGGQGLGGGCCTEDRNVECRRVIHAGHRSRQLESPHDPVVGVCVVAGGDISRQPEVDRHGGHQTTVPAGSGALPRHLLLLLPPNRLGGRAVIARAGGPNVQARESREKSVRREKGRRHANGSGKSVTYYRRLSRKLQDREAELSLSNGASRRRDEEPDPNDGKDERDQRQLIAASMQLLERQERRGEGDQIPQRREGPKPVLPLSPR